MPNQAAMNPMMAWQTRNMHERGGRRQQDNTNDRVAYPTKEGTGPTKKDKWGPTSDNNIRI